MPAEVLWVISTMETHMTQLNHPISNESFIGADICQARIRIQIEVEKLQLASSTNRGIVADGGGELRSFYNAPTLQSGGRYIQACSQVLHSTPLAVIYTHYSMQDTKRKMQRHDTTSCCVDPQKAIHMHCLDSTCRISAVPEW